MAPSAGQPAVQQPPQTGVLSGNYVPLAPNVPLAASPDQTTNHMANVPLAPMLESTTNVANSNVKTDGTNTATTNQTLTSPSNVPLAPFPNDPQAHKGSASTLTIFNISVYTITSIFVARMF